MDNKNTVIKESKAGLAAHIIASVLYVLIGLVMLLVDSSIVSTIVYSFSIIAIGILFICFGAYYMIKYFFNGEYKRITNYGFTMGVILVIIGAAMIFKAAELSAFIDALVCLITIVLGAVMLQQAFALFHIERSAWFFNLILGFGTIGVAVWALVTQVTFFNGQLIGSIVLISIGAISLLCLLIMVLGLRDSKRDAKRVYNRHMDEEPDVSTNDTIFEDEPIVEPIVEETKIDTPDSDTLFDE